MSVTNLLSTLSTAELDQLIAEAVEQRAQREDPWPVSAGPGEGIRDPCWRVVRHSDATVLEVLHLGVGWIRLLIREPDLSNLVSSLSRRDDASERGPTHAVPLHPGKSAGRKKH